MKKALLAFIASLLSLPTYSQHLQVGWELWFPYQYRNKAQQLVGLDIDVFKAIIKQANYQASYVELPWQRHLRYIKSGKIDIAFGASYTKERESYAYFTQAYRKEIVKLFIRKNNHITLQKLSNLIDSPYIIGIEKGYYYGEEFAQLMLDPSFKKHIKIVLNIEENIDLLLKNKIDGLLADPNTIKAFVKKYRIDNELTEHSLPIYQTDIHIMLSKKTLDTKTLQQFDQAITTLKLNGAVDAIFAKWQNSIELSYK